MTTFSQDPATWVVSAVLLVLLLGGAAAMSAGRALARAWRPFAIAPAYMIAIAGAVGFLQYAIFGLSPIPLYDIGADLALVATSPLAGLRQILEDCAYWAGVAALLTGFAFVSYRLTRRRQMCGRYHWAFEPAGFWSWRARTPS